MRYRRVLLLIAALLFAVAGVARADDAQTLLAKHKAYVGWQFGDGNITSLVLTRDAINANGVLTQRAIEHRIALVYRRDYYSNSSSGSTGFTGQVFWGTNGNGFTIPYVGSRAMNSLALDALFMEGTSELLAEMRPSATLDGKTIPVVRVTMKGAEPIDLYIDPDTGAYLRAVIDPGGGDETGLTIKSYRTIAGGKRLIGSWSFDGEKTTYAYTKVEVNAAVSNQQLHPPAPSATWMLHNDQPFPIRVTPDRMYVNAVVNGVSGRFIIDTGASAIFLTDDFANRAHVKTIGRSLAYGTGGTAKSLVRLADTIAVGGNILYDAVVSTINETLDDKQYHETVDGLLGYDLFAGTQVALNLSNQTMRIQSADGAATVPPGGIPVVVDLSGERPVAPMKIDDKLDINALLDTGGYNFSIVSRQIRDHGVIMVSSELTENGQQADQGFLGGNRVIRGVGGDERVYCGTLDKIALGPLVYTGMAICESYQWNLHDGAIGFDFLRHFDYIFDYPHSTIIMIPHKE